MNFSLSNFRNKENRVFLTSIFLSAILHLNVAFKVNSILENLGGLNGVIQRSEPFSSRVDDSLPSLFRLFYLEYGKSKVPELDNVKDQFLHLNKGFIPPELANSLAEFLLGQMSVESGFKLNAKSKSGSIGILQILPKNLKKIDKLDEKNIKVQIYSAFSLYKLIYDILLVYGVHPKGIITSEGDLDPINHNFASKYNLSKDEYNKFLVLVMINSYQTGPGRMLRIVNSFYKEVSFEQADKRKDKTGAGLYALLVDYAKYKGFRLYGNESQQYVPLVLAYSEIFR